MSQSVQPLPVVVNFGGNVLVLKDDACHAALAPLYRKEGIGGGPSLVPSLLPKRLTLSKDWARLEGREGLALYLGKSLG